jgi:hypothetical protein
MLRRCWYELINHPWYQGNFMKYLRTINGILTETIETLEDGDTYIKRRLSTRQMFQVVHILRWAIVDELPNHDIKVCMYPAEVCCKLNDCSHNATFHHMDIDTMKLCLYIGKALLVVFPY